MGKIELDHTGSGSGVTLSSDGTDLLLDGTAIGGGAASELYAENPSSPTAPSATGANAVAIGRQATATNSDSFSFGYNARAQGQFSTAIGASALAGNSQGSTAIGFTAVSQGTSATALGDSYASGTDSFAAAIANNTSSYGATGANSVAMGSQAKASGSRAFSLGRFGQATNTRSINIGDSAICSGDSALAIGYTAAASQSFSTALGYRSSSDIVGKYAYAGGVFTATGDSQTGTFVLRSDTTDATAEALTTNNSAAGTTNQVVVPTNAAFAFHGTIVAKQSGSANAAAWKVEGLIVNNGGTTTLTNSATTVLSNTPSWGMALSADNTNNALAITATGAAATNIRWVATINTSEVTYA